MVHRDLVQVKCTVELVLGYIVMENYIIETKKSNSYTRRNNELLYRAHL